MTISTTTLKNAAKAIGYDLWSDPDGSHYLVDYDGVKLKRWDPEHSSADSFELAVSLRLTVDVTPWGVNANEWNAHSDNSAMYGSADTNGDHSLAARLAILTRAAIIGAKLCQS